LLERTKFVNKRGKDGNACTQRLQTKLQDLITTSTNSDSNRNKSIIQHYIQGKPTDYGTKNYLFIQDPTQFRGLPSSEKYLGSKLIDTFLKMHTDGFSCGSILRTRHNVSQNCRTQRSITYYRPTQQF
jgi:hypothetical protein